MSLKAAVAFIFIALCLASAALAGEPSKSSPRRVDSHQSSYEGSCASGGWGVRAVTIPAAGDGKAFKGEGLGAATAANQLFRFGEQLAVQCTEDSMVCESMTTSATIATTSGVCAENCGMATFDSASSRSGVMNCHFVTADAPEKFIKISPDGWTPYPGDTATFAGKNVTIRRGRCTTVSNLGALGGGCNTNAECGSSGVCSLVLEPLGVYLLAFPAANNGVCRVAVCGQ